MLNKYFTNVTYEASLVLVLIFTTTTYVTISLNIAIRKYRYEQYSQKLILKIQIKNRTASCVHIAPETLLQRFRQKDIDEQLKKEKSKDNDVISEDI